MRTQGDPGSQDCPEPAACTVQNPGGGRRWLRTQKRGHLSGHRAGLGPSCPCPGLRGQRGPDSGPGRPGCRGRARVRKGSEKVSAGRTDGGPRTGPTLLSPGTLPARCPFRLGGEVPLPPTYNALLALATHVPNEPGPLRSQDESLPALPASAPGQVSGTSSLQPRPSRAAPSSLFSTAEGKLRPGAARAAGQQQPGPAVAMVSSGIPPVTGNAVGALGPQERMGGCGRRKSFLKCANSVENPEKQREGK